MSTMNVDSLLAADHALMLSRRSGDRETHQRLLAPEYIGVDVAGNVTTKADRVDSFGSLAYVSIETDEHLARVVGETGFVTARMRAEGNAGAEQFAGVYRYTHVYCWSAEGWRAVATHVCQMDL